MTEVLIEVQGLELRGFHGALEEEQRIGQSFLFDVELVACESEIGSGALPAQRIASAGLALRPGTAATAARFRNLPLPVIGRLHEGRFVHDVRSLEDEAGFVAQLERL